MSEFVPNSFHVKKTAAESHWLLVAAYREHASSNTTCIKWFQRFRNGDFDGRNDERERPPTKLEHAELQAFLDGDDTQTKEHMAQ